jgi:hypothetical protein
MKVGDRDNLITRDNVHDWVLASENVAKVLAARCYHYQFVFAANAGHTDSAVKQQTLPEALEYVWQRYPVKNEAKRWQGDGRDRDQLKSTDDSTAFVPNCAGEDAVLRQRIPLHLSLRPQCCTGLLRELTGEAVERTRQQLEEYHASGISSGNSSPSPNGFAICNYASRSANSATLKKTSLCDLLAAEILWDIEALLRCC